MSTLTSVAHVAIPRTVVLPAGVEGDNWALFLSVLALHTSLTRERRDGGHWVNLHSERLRSLIGSSYQRRIRAMIEAGVVEQNNRYSTGKEGVAAFTKSYRLAAQHRTGQSRLHAITTLPTARKAVKTFDVDPTNLGPAGMHYRDCFDRLTLHTDAADDSHLAGHWDQWTIARWRNRQEFAHRCEYGRYHSLTTQLPRGARRHLRTLDGESLAVVDVSACQPLLLGHQASHHMGQTTPAATLLPYVARFSETTGGKMLPDVARWIELCESRLIYQHFYDAIQTFDGSTKTTILLRNGRKVEIDLRTIRERSFKRATLVPVFDTIESMKRSPVFRIMQRDFPPIAGFTLDAKRNGHQRLACLLQSTEAALMIDGLGNMLAERYPSVTVQPIHDALLVPVSFAETAAELIREQFETVGLRPHVKIELG